MITKQKYRCLVNDLAPVNTSRGFLPEVLAKAEISEAPPPHQSILRLLFPSGFLVVVLTVVTLLLGEPSQAPAENYKNYVTNTMVISQELKKALASSIIKIN